MTIVSANDEEDEEEQEAEKEDASIPTETMLELTNYCGHDTMSYVIGSIIKRLGCEVCAEKLAVLLSKEESVDSFASSMTYERGHLYKPSFEPASLWLCSL